MSTLSKMINAKLFTLWQGSAMTTKELLDTIARRPFLLVTLAFAIAALYGPDANLTLFYLHRQDRWLLLAAALLLALSVWKLPARTRSFAGDWRLAFGVGLVMAAIAFVGHYWILSGYDLSRDEQMATFDAAVYARWTLTAPLTGVWRDHAAALNTMFMYPADPRASWLSDYLPFNAALRAWLGLVATPTLAGPLMTFLGALAIWLCGRRIWPERHEPAIVGLLLYAGSAQILVNGMTAYAMPAHLTLNLLWLWLFLQRCWWRDVLALMTGFVAVGLHQPIMHPMFAGPILFLLLMERNWRRAALYFTGYAAIGLFWIWWPLWMSMLVQSGDVAQDANHADYVTRLMSALAKGDGLRVANMVSNLLRFVAWQHLLLVPLFVLGLSVVRRDRLAGALAAGILLTVVTMAVILPYQGHGFGYRYLHGLIGSCILLAVYGWESVRETLAEWRSLLLRTTCLGIIVLLPLQLWMAHGFYAPPAAVSARIDRSLADYVVIGEDDAPFSIDLVINRPFLDNGPIRLQRGALTPELVKILCISGPTIALAEPRHLEPILRYYGLKPPFGAANISQKVGSQLRRAGCEVIPLR